jgi:Oligogalacturonate lyase
MRKALLGLVCAVALQAQPESWIDPDTGHRVARLPIALFTVDAKTGEMKVTQRSTDWLNHLEFNPSDPTLLMFCHEGPWHKVDRICWSPM